MKEGKWTWLNGKFVLSESPQLHIFIQGLQYGFGGFEGIQCYPTEKGPAIFRLWDHIKRLRYTSEILGFNLPYSDEQITEAIKETIKKNEFTACYIRPYVGATERKIGLVVNGEKSIVAVSVAADWTYFGKPARAEISRYVRPHPKSFPMEAKCSGIYVNSILAKQEAKKHGFDEAILLDYEGYVAEASAANIFLVTRNGSIFTPRKGSILPGITRDTVIQICKDLKYPIFELNVGLIDLYQATEVFVCGTAAEITPVVCIDYGNPIEKPLNIVGDGKTGPMAAKLQELYKKIVTGQESKYEHWLEYV